MELHGVSIMEVKMSALYIYTIIKFVIDLVFILLCKWDPIAKFVINLLKRTIT